MSSNRNIIDSDLSLSRCPDIITSQPLPDQWVLVKQLNMETREPCEIWRSGVHNQIKKMQYQLTMVCKELQNLDREIHHKLQSTTLNDNVDDDTEPTDGTDHEENSDQ